MSVTIADVAARASVSKTTVSRGWLVGLGVVVLLWRGEAGDHFQAR
jgi:hypothetical protein